MITLSSFLNSISSAPHILADVLVKAKVAKNAARIIKGKFLHREKDQNSIINVMPNLISSIEFQPYLNIYKHSSYYSSDNKSYSFANLIGKYL